MSSIQITALVIILLYMAATVAIGLIVSRMKQSREAKQSNDDFLMASKSLGPVVLAGTLFAANTGGASTTGIATNVYTYGLSACWYVIAAGVGFVLVSFIAPYFRKAQANTVPEIISKRYGKASHIFTAFTSIAALFMATGAQIIATASIINVVTGLSFQTAAIVTTAVVIVYTMIGGFKSVTAANLMHVLFITVGMTIAMFIMVNNKEVWISRVTMVVEGLVGLFVALTASNVISVMMGAFALRSAGPFAAFICGIFYKNVTQRAGFLSIVAGTVVAAVWIYILNTPWGLSAMVPGGIVAFAVIFLVSAIEQGSGVPAAPAIEFEED